MNRQLERGLGVALVSDAGRAERDLWAIAARLYRDGVISYAERERIRDVRRVIQCMAAEIERRDEVMAAMPEPVLIRSVKAGGD